MTIPDATIRKARRVSIVSEWLGVNRSTVHRMLEDGRLEGYRVGCMRYIFVDSIEKYQRSYAS